MILKKMIVLVAIVAVIFSGCSKDEDVDWKPSPTFTIDNMSLNGTKEKFGIIKVNGEGSEPEFPVGEGRQYQVFFFDKSKDLNGKKYKMVATHKKTGETVELYEWDISLNQSGAKFALDKEGIWKIDVLVDGEKYTSFVIEAISS